jgi:hypothetical protein
MKRPLAVCLATIVLVGCRSAGQTTDPFFGRSTVEPPRTGVAGGSRPPAYYSGTPANGAASTPRQPVVGTQPNVNSSPAGVYSSPATRPTYGANQSLTSSPSAGQSNQRLLPSSGPIEPPRVGIPSQPSPWSTSPGYAQPTVPTTSAPALPTSAPAPTTSAPAAALPTPTAPLVPVGVQPQISTPATGPTLRPAAAIPAPGTQGQCVPAYPCNPYYPCYPADSANAANCSLAGRQRIVRPLQTRQCIPCPAGTVPCVPTYNPCRTATSTGGTINITDLPEPKPKL